MRTLLLLLAACVGPKGDDTGAAQDLDGDGYAAAEDCDDGDASAHPGADERCGGADEDCDGLTDEADAAGSRAWYPDNDGDGFGDGRSPVLGCEVPEGYTANGDDCDDGDAASSPGADERCDGLDNNCDGLADEDAAIDARIWYADSDADGYGDPLSPVTACAQPSAAVSDDTDCDDSLANVYPGAPEFCDSHDNNCDGFTDEDAALDASTWFADADADGYGDPVTATFACAQPSGFLPDATDCDDLRATVYPGAPEVCDTLDNDCDGFTDEDAALDAPTWFADTDADGYGDAAATTSACLQPSGFVPDSRDCDDADPARNPGTPELCDGLDNNCDGSTDEPGAADGAVYWPDADGDGYGDSSAPTRLCAALSGYLSVDGDCDDAEATAYPGGAELCWNGIDEDCDTASVSCERSRRWVEDGPIHISGTVAWDYFGRDLAVQDVDLDGTDDLVAISNSRIFLFPGPLASTTTASASWTVNLSSGYRNLEHLALLDVDGSGRPDVVVSSSLGSSGIGAGVTLLFTDPTPGTLTEADADAIWDGYGTGFMGSCLFPTPDIDGDGLPDIGLCNAPNGTFSGTVHVVSGATRGSTNYVEPSSLLTLTSDGSSGFFGFPATMGGDLTGDGLDDLLIADSGIVNSTTGVRGAVWVVPGPLPGGTYAASALGWALEGDTDTLYVDSLVGAGDLDGDGYGDILFSVTLNYQTFGTPLTYALQAAYGPTSTSGDLFATGDRMLIGQLIQRIDPTEDLNGDGFVDVITTYGSYITNGTGVAVSLGPFANSGTMMLSDSYVRYASATNWTLPAAGTDDIDQNGYSDLVVGINGYTNGSSYSSGSIFVVSGFVE